MAIWKSYCDELFTFPHFHKSTVHGDYKDKFTIYGTMLSRLVQSSASVLVRTSQRSAIARISISAQDSWNRIHNVHNGTLRRNLSSIQRLSPILLANPTNVSQKPHQTSQVNENEQLIFESQLGHTLLPRFAWLTTALFGLGVVMVTFLTFREDVGDIRSRILSRRDSNQQEQAKDYNHFQFLQKRKLSGLDTSASQRVMIGIIPVSVVGLLLLVVKRGGSRLVSRMYLLPRNRVRIECSNPWKSRKVSKEMSQIHAIDAIIPGTSITADVSQMFQPMQVLVNPCDPSSTLKTYYVPAGGNLKEKLDTGRLAIMEKITFGNTSRPDARAGTVSMNEIDLTDARSSVAFRRPAHKE